MNDKVYTSAKEIERAKALWEKGVLLAEHTEGFKKMMLYQLHDVYIEVILHIRRNIVVRVSTFTDTKHLDAYLENISLEDLLS